jgi:hypothetical protein
VNAVLVALIVVFGTVAGPLFLSHLNNRQRRAEKIEDYARQDAVAAQSRRGGEAAAGVQQKESRDRGDNQRQTGRHPHLVNSTLTAAIEAHSRPPCSNWR